MLKVENYGAICSQEDGKDDEDDNVAIIIIIIVNTFYCCPTLTVSWRWVCHRVQSDVAGFPYGSFPSLPQRLCADDEMECRASGNFHFF